MKSYKEILAGVKKQIKAALEAEEEIVDVYVESRHLTTVESWMRYNDIHIVSISVDKKTGESFLTVILHRTDFDT